MIVAPKALLTYFPFWVKIKFYRLPILLTVAGSQKPDGF
jgi:hypothetical protein